MTVHLLISEGYLDYISYTLGVVLPNAFEAAGANVITHDDVQNLSPAVGDKLIVMGSLTDSTMTALSKFEPVDRWSFVCDVQKSEDPGPYVRAVAYAKDVLKTSNIITTYETPEHMHWLEANGMRHVTMPHCMPSIRKRITKHKQIIMTGQVDMRATTNDVERLTNVYTMRTNIADALKGSDLKSQVTWLNHPGHSLSTLKHDVVFDRYLETLDDHRIGIVCKGGMRDSMVSKYVEYGACHVLPVGDVPSYMPRAMSEAMINVEGFSAAEIIAELKRLLANVEELDKRTEVYVEQIKKHYIGDVNARRVIDEMYK